MFTRIPNFDKKNGVLYFVTVEQYMHAAKVISIFYMKITQLKYKKTIFIIILTYNRPCSFETGIPFSLSWQRRIPRHKRSLGGQSLLTMMLHGSKCLVMTKVQNLKPSSHPDLSHDQWWQGAAGLSFLRTRSFCVSLKKQETPWLSSVHPGTSYGG